jgi:predicted nuclease of predicted toxin-antitoxin system
MISLLIDEDLSRELAKVAITRGFHALSVRNMHSLRGKDDGAIVRYAIKHNMILVTRNKVDHEAILANIDCHPGVVFFVVGHPKLNELKYQKIMMDLALNDIQDQEPVQEALLVTARGRPGNFEMTVDRYYLPDL